jgi:hypothetical protein
VKNLEEVHAPPALATAGKPFYRPTMWVVCKKSVVGHLKSPALLETRMPDRSGQKQCPLCPKIVRGDTLGRHMCTHKKQFISTMSLKAKQGICDIKKPIMYGGDAHAGKCFAVCLYCNRCVNNVVKHHVEVFIQKHTNKECLEAWSSHEHLFSHVPPEAPETPIQNVVTVPEVLPETQYKKTKNTLSDSTVENLKAWAKHNEEDSEELDDIVGYVLDAETYKAEKLDGLCLDRLYDIGRHYGEEYTTHGEALDALIEKVQELQAQVDRSRHV